MRGTQTANVRDPTETVMTREKWKGKPRKKSPRIKKCCSSKIDYCHVYRMLLGMYESYIWELNQHNVCRTVRDKVARGRGGGGTRDRETEVTIVPHLDQLERGAGAGVIMTMHAVFI